MMRYYQEQGDSEKARQVAEQGKDRCKDDPTDIYIFLLEDARKQGDESRYKKLYASARRHKLLWQEIAVHGKIEQFTAVRGYFKQLQQYREPIRKRGETMTNKERRDAQMAYISDGAIMEEQKICRRKLQKLNFMDRSDFDGIAEAVKDLLGASEGAFINPPFYCDYGSHIEMGKNVFINYNCTILDVAKVKIGDNCQFAPNVAIYTAGHPIHPVSRNSLYEYGKEVTIGNNVWLGGNVVICPGVHIGDNAVIGAGSVVTKDIPAWSLAAGNPCRVIRAITDADKRKLFRSEEVDDEAWEAIAGRADAGNDCPDTL